MNFRELKQEDIDAVKDDSISRGILSKQPEKIDYSYCLEHQGKVLGIGGIRLINETTAFAWIDLSTNAENYIITVYRTIKEWSEILCRDKGIKRLMAYVATDFPKAIRTVEHLGFRQESIMPRFIGEKSAYLFVKHYGVSDDTSDKEE